MSTQTPTASTWRRAGHRLPRGPKAAVMLLATSAGAFGLLGASTSASAHVVPGAVASGHRTEACERSDHLRALRPFHRRTRRVDRRR